MKFLKNKYVLTTLISLLIISIIFIIKGIFPFGSNSVIWSDMHEQITALYYRFYDGVHNGNLFVDFSAGGAVNLVGVIAYYILSPFTALVLLFPRDMIPEAVSLIVGLKIVLSGVTCMFFIDRYFNKLKNSEKIFLSLLYAFSSYNLAMYVITGWMDIVYLFPLLMVGLKELLDLNDKKLYILILAISFVFNYYLALIILIFIVIASAIYLYVFNKKNMKKAIFTLGICTVIAVLLSSVVLVPAVLQTLTSQRAGIDFRALINSSKGPLADKIALLFTSAPLIAFTILLLINHKKHSKMSKFIFPLIILIGLPILIEPINKMWHFGSYVCFPYRYGFTFIFLLVIAAAYYLEKVDNKFNFDKQKILSIGGVALTLILTVVGFIKRNSIRTLIYKLSFTKNKLAFLIVISLFVVSIITFLLLELKKSKKNKVVIYTLAIISILFNSYLYFGFYDYDPLLKEQYKTMNEMTELKDEAGIYNVKRLNRELISNFGMVTGLRSFSNFTSLTPKDTFMTFQRLGYDSFWMDTESIGGNLFTDTVLGYKYILSEKELSNPYYDFYKQYENTKVYKYNKDMPFGYTLKKTDNLEKAIDDSKNSFEASNIIYNYITGKDKIIDVIDLEYNDTVIEKEIEVKNKQEVYLEVFTNFDSNKKTRTYDSFNIYVNDVLFIEKYPNSKRNGTLDLGLFENTKVRIKIEVLSKKVQPRNISVGLLDLSKYDEFINGNYGNIEVDIDKNVITVGTYGDSESTVFVPIPNIGYKVKDGEVGKAFGAFLTVKTKAGISVTELAFIPKGIVIGLVLSVLGLALLLIVDRVNMFDINILNNGAHLIFMAIYYILLGIYVIGTLAFLITFVHKI